MYDDLHTINFAEKTDQVEAKSPTFKSSKILPHPEFYLSSHIPHEAKSILDNYLSPLCVIIWLTEKFLVLDNQP